MATNLVQGDLNTFWAAAQSSSTGPYNEIGTDVGEFRAGTISTSFETNVASIIALVEFLVANSSDPTTSETTYMAARRQRKLLKEMLMKLSARLKPVSNGNSDDRATFADNILARTVTWYNLNNRPDAI